MIYIDKKVEACLSWRDAVDALRAGHLKNKISTMDMLTTIRNGEILTRAASIEDLGSGIKSVTIIPENKTRTPSVPTIQGLFILFDEGDGRPLALIDGAFLTKWKTIADSLLGASLLARPEPEILTVCGTGAIAAGLIEGYQDYYPSLKEVRLWGRTEASAVRLRDGLSAKASRQVSIYGNLKTAVQDAHIITCATASKTPIIKGEWIMTGAHVDLIGAHGPDMREADDRLLQRARLYVDDKETTIDHIGEFKIPISQGVLTRQDIIGDLYMMVREGAKTFDSGKITLFKNGGGAHLDLIMAHYLVRSAEKMDDGISDFA